jgi:peptidoglycan/LPS O-acetylase OafA/YrhL
MQQPAIETPVQTQTRSRAESAGAVVHRPDIDGLRALAVLAVIAYHVGTTVAPGGFVGVDIFFVISGYLITQLLYRDICAARFSVVSFYERRVRRIFPALLAMLLAVFVAGLLCYLPAEMLELSKSLTAALLSASNFYFWLTIDYFDSRRFLPVVHTWSLAVEEQFYLFWPLLLWVLYRFGRPCLLIVTAGLGAASLVASIVGAWLFPSANFYLPWTRIWELDLGALLALGAVRMQVGPMLRNVLAGLGLVLILGSIRLIKAADPFPGFLALPPCLGAALVIQAGRDGGSGVARLLSLPPLVFVGLISYSLYIWHVPILAFYTYEEPLGAQSAHGTKVLLLALILIVGALSWRFIEQPFRTGRLRPSSRRLLQIMAPATTAVLLLGLAGWTTSGFPARFSQHELQVASYEGSVTQIAASWRGDRCFLWITSGDRQRLAPECLALAKDRKNYLVLGDSHAAALWPGLQSTFKDVNFLQATTFGCVPTVTHGPTERAACTHLIDDVLQGFLSRERVDGVLLVARWEERHVPGVEATLAWMTKRHIPVTLFGPSVIYDNPLPRLMVARDVGRLERHLLPESQLLDAVMSRLASTQGVPYVSLRDLQCDTPSCSPGDLPIFFDTNHYTLEGSGLIARRLRDSGKVSW